MFQTHQNYFRDFNWSIVSVEILKVIEVRQEKRRKFGIESDKTA